MKRAAYTAVVTVLALVVYLCTGLVAQEVVAPEQWMQVIGVNAGGGAEFPSDASVRYHIDIHTEDVPGEWAAITDSLAHTGAGDTMRVAYDLPQDGIRYEFRSFAIVEWGDGTVEYSDLCYSGWVLARRVESPPEPCGWLAR